MKVFVINGAPGSGKTTFEKFIQEEYSDCAIISTVDYVKTVAKYVGWDGTKTLKNRKFLSDLKDLLTEWEDIPFISTVEKCKEYDYIEHYLVLRIHHYYYFYYNYFLFYMVKALMFYY